MNASPLDCFHVGNLLTYLSLCAALGAVAAALHGSAPAAGALLALAVVADTFDGRFARMFRRSPGQRAFGAQLDSLSDAAAFGMAPAVCMAALAPSVPSLVVEVSGWLAVFLYAACAITRLGFFNLHASDGAFVGLPVPVAALIWTSLMLFHPGWLPSLAIFAATAVAMVAPIPVPRPSGAGLAVFALWPLAVGAVHLAALIS